MRLEANQPLPNIKPSCLGCRTFFTLQQELSPSTPSYFDMVDLPIKKNKQRVQLLRIICAFLSSKGGHIYLGIDKKNIQVKGIKITTKQQDEFKFYVKQLLGKVHPKVDLSNREEVETVFIPVLSQGKEPTGRTIIKIIVKQGQLDRVYTYVEKVKVTNPKGGEPQQFQLRYGFVMDGDSYLRLQGIKLIDQISKKAKGLTERCRFHEGCNAKPLQVDPSVKLITFQGFETVREQNSLLNLLKLNLKQQDISFDFRYNDKDKVLILEFHTENDVIAVQKLLGNSLPQLKKMGLRISFQGVQFNTYVYKKIQEIPSEQKSTQQKEIKEQDKKLKEKGSKIIYGISNYKATKRDELLRTIKQQLPQSLSSQAKFYSHSSILELKNQQSVRMINTVIGRLPNINIYTNSVNDGQLAFGKITGQILVYGVYEKCRENFRDYVMKKFPELQKVGFENDKGKLVIVLKFTLKDVNEALDKLITDYDQELRKFGKDSKMGYCLECE